MRKLLAVVVLVMPLAVLTSCALAPMLGGTGVACVSWVHFETDSQRAEAADLIVIVDEVTPDGTMKIIGYDANAYRVRVVDIEKGAVDLVGPSMYVRVGSTADSCAAHPYGEDGDQMLQELPLRLYLTAGEGGMKTLTPFEGAHPVDDREE